MFYFRDFIAGAVASCFSNHHSMHSRAVSWSSATVRSWTNVTAKYRM